MALQSQLFKGDAKLEAAAVSDPAHIIQGARGPHVAKLQQALNALDGANLDADGAFGPATAAAVRAFKTKRKILNSAGKIDDIVGKKSAAALDTGMLAAEAAPPTPPAAPPPFKPPLLRLGFSVGGTAQRPPGFITGTTDFDLVQGVNHGHAAKGKFAAVKARPYDPFFPFESDFVVKAGITVLIQNSKDEAGFVNVVQFVHFRDLPLAKAHIQHYLTGGGADFNEDDNIAAWLQADVAPRRLIRDSINRNRGAGRFFFEEAEFKAVSYTKADFRDSFGGIDRLKWEVDFDVGFVHVFFKDRYEWHPVYDFYDRQSGDSIRNTNPIHAAMVEMKRQGAADYWMVGEAFVPIGLFFT